MITRTLKVENPHGIHMRVAAKIVEIAQKNRCRLDFFKNGVKASAESILDLLILGAGYQSRLQVSAEGANEKTAMEAIELLLTDGAGI